MVGSYIQNLTYLKWNKNRAEGCQGVDKGLSGRSNSKTFF